MPNWGDFSRKHILDPVVENCMSWNREQWNNWLRNRLPSEFGRRSVNSVVVSSPDNILADFQNLNHPYQNQNNFYWSNNCYRIFALVIDHNMPADSPYRVYNFGEMFFLVKISPNPNVPIHYHAQNTSQVPSGKPNIVFSNYPQVE